MMTGSALFMMILGMLILWGGLVLSVMNAVRKSKQ